MKFLSKFAKATIVGAAILSLVGCGEEKKDVATIDGVPAHIKGYHYLRDAIRFIQSILYIEIIG